jgi:hypothetical protein
MGEKGYAISGWWSEEEHYLQFSDSDDDYACLCTFSGNDMGQLDLGEVRSLALFGAAVRLAFSDELEHGILPGAVPEWIREEIDRVIGWEKEEGIEAF